MAAIPTILKGDDSGSINITLDADHDYTDATLVFAYQGVTRTFTGLTAGGTVPVVFTHDETAKFNLGCYPIEMELVGATGGHETVSNGEQRIKVTDIPSEVNSGTAFAVKPGSVSGVPVTEIGDMPSRYTLEQLAAKVNEIVKVLAQRTSIILLTALLSSAFASVSAASAPPILAALSVQTCVVSNLYNDAEVVTNVSGEISVDTDAVKGIVTNTVTKSYVEGLGISGGGGSSGIDEAAVKNIVESGSVTNAGAVAEAKAYADGTFLPTSGGALSGVLFAYEGVNTGAGNIEAGGATVKASMFELTSPSFEFISTSEGTTLPAYLASTGWHGSDKSLTDYGITNKTGITKTEADAAYFPKTEGAAWSRYWGGDDFVVTITNYPTERGATRSPSGKMPHLFMSWKTSDDDGEYQQVVWDEEWWQNWLLGTYLPTNYLSKAETLAALDEKADRAWGFYDSHTGLLAPDGYTQISSSNIMIAAGMGYQKTVTTEGEVWVLTADSTDVQLSPTTGGQFRISDSEGNSVFEIVKGDKRTVGASPGATAIIGAYAITHLQIHYYVDSDAHPTLQICNDLKGQDWKDETDADCLATVEWSGSKGDWVAVVYGKTVEPQLFVKASYEIGGETYIKNTAPVSMEYIYLGGVKYKLGTATISGNTVLTLTAQ